MTEKLLQFIWQYKLFDTNKLKCTTQNVPLEILQVGTLNTNAGPDFENGKLKIGNTIWAGSIELHINASDWHKHKHDAQATYSKIIAHVVYNADVEITDRQGNIIPCVELKQAINLELINNYQLLMDNMQAVACAQKIHAVKEIVQLQQWDKMVVERLLQKSLNLQELLLQTNNNWSEVFYLNIAKVFGGNVNGDAFMALASRLPLKILAKHKNNVLQLEALLFGVAGLIPLANNLNDNYITNLQSEFDFLQKKYSLQTMEAQRWKFMRMRPTNFPTIRISQFADLIFKSNFLFSGVIEKHLQLTELEKMFNCRASNFWDTRFTFWGETHLALPKKIGTMQIHNILINAVSPTLYVYGKQMDSESHSEQALMLLQQLPPEKNKITKLYTDLGLQNKNAFSSQAYIQQFKNYCSLKKCLVCSIGYSILKH